MNSRFATVMFAGIAAMFGAISASPSAAQDPPPPARTQLDGVYTDEQATRGEPLYTKLCGSCHAPDLAGSDKAPPLAGVAFDANWSDKKLGELSERSRTTMPVDNPGSLTRAQNADILAFMLKKAGAPAGTTALPTNVDQINAIKYVVKK